VIGAARRNSPTNKKSPGLARGFRFLVSSLHSEVGQAAPNLAARANQLRVICETKLTRRKHHLRGNAQVAARGVTRGVQTDWIRDVRRSDEAFEIPIQSARAVPMEVPRLPICGLAKDIRERT
jgi:hypothetical protein